VARKWFKGPAALAVDEWYGTGDIRANLELARSYLQQEDLSFADLVAQLSSAGRGHDAFQYPFGRGRLQGPQFEAIARRGYLEAIGLALGHSPPVPIRTYWMTGVGNNEFEMHVSDEPDQVALTLVVPEVDGGSAEPGHPESWVVTLRDDGHPETTQTSGRRGLDRPSTRGTAAR